MRKLSGVEKQRAIWTVFAGAMVALLLAFGSPIVAHAQQEPTPGESRDQLNAPPNDEMIKAGELIYFRKCVWCHGEKGGGDGPSADRLWPRPRSFVEGTFKIRHTASGEIPTDQDLFLTVTNGLPGSAMPPWDGILNEKERKDVIQFIKYRLVKDVDFGDPDEDIDVIDYGKQTPMSEDSIKRGEDVFRKKGKCLECHGEEARGDGNKTQKDEWGFPIFPADLHKCWNFRGNRRDPYNPRNIFREVSTGLNGTPMPSFADVLSPEERWDVANFIISKCEKGHDGKPLAIDPLTDHPVIHFVVKSFFQQGEIPNNPDDPAWQEKERTFIGLAGQITHKPRNFVRLVDDVWVRSLYNDNDVAYLLEWDDRTKSVGTPETMAQASQIRETPPAGDPVAYKYGTFVTNDSVGIAFAAKWQDLTPPLKPRFINGDEANHQDVWKWDADGTVGEYTGKGWNHPLEKRPAKDLKVVASVFKNGRWRVILQRPRETGDKENDVQFETGKYIPTVFYAWDGHNGDYGLKRSISTFYYSFLIPPIPSTVYYIPVIGVGIVVAFEFWILGKVKEAKNQKK
jgi:mono/diheme cytochrome c family protein